MDAFDIFTPANTDGRLTALALQDMNLRAVVALDGLRLVSQGATTSSGCAPTVVGPSTSRGTSGAGSPPTGCSPSRSSPTSPTSSTSTDSRTTTPRSRRTRPDWTFVAAAANNGAQSDGRDSIVDTLRIKSERIRG